VAARNSAQLRRLENAFRTVASLSRFGVATAGGGAGES